MLLSKRLSVLKIPLYLFKVVCVVFWEDPLGFLLIPFNFLFAEGLRSPFFRDMENETSTWRWKPSITWKRNNLIQNNLSMFVQLS